MKRLVAAFCAAISLSTCQGTPIGDAMIGDEKLAQMDDQYCRSIGEAPQTQAYAQCRMMKTAQREQSHQQAYQRAAGFAAAGASMQQSAASTYRPVNCTTTPRSTFVGGNPSSYSTTCY
ncbi:hypothetical protein [Ensifer adhaerens]|uniref:hypothetical protein n=1 Tax=Ensifer adhaerens TaxID=106592 RepID=UPI000DC2298A|nr:hypothetical protein [Ensifer adhaerens]RAS13558.1 hypothetical protein DEU52_106156 [Ensifer adhaerens]